MKPILTFGLMLLAVIVSRTRLVTIPLLAGTVFLGMALAVKDAATAGDKFVARGRRLAPITRPACEVRVNAGKPTPKREKTTGSRRSGIDHSKRF